MTRNAARNWFRKTTWSEEDRAEFERRLAKSRPHSRAQYLRIQAFHLAEADDAELLRAALGLLSRVTTEYSNDAFQVVQAHAQRADCHWRLADLRSAVEAYRATFDLERTVPNLRTNAWLEFGWRVVRSNRVELYSEVEALFESRARDGGWPLPFPVQKYRFHAVRAVIADARGARAEASMHARQALEAARLTESPFRYHRDLGLVRDADDALARKLRELAS